MSAGLAMGARRARPRVPALARYILRRLAIAVGLLLGSTIVGFLLVQAVPGNPVAANLSDQALGDPAAVAAFETKWGLNKPLPVQYLTYLGNLLRGDLGTSQQTGHPVLTDLMEHAPATLELVVPAIVLSLVLSIAIGMFAALRHGRAVDQIVRAGSMLGLAVPPFWLSLLALYLFFFVLGVSPNGGRLSSQFAPPPSVTGIYPIDALLGGETLMAWDAVQHSALPVLVLTVITTATLVRFVRSALLEVLGKEYITAAYAKGLPTKTVLFRHLLRAGLVQIMTMTGLTFASMLAGTVLIESIFSWPGLGSYAYSSASTLDRPAILGVSLFVATVYILINLVVDLLYGLADPRIRLS